MVHYVFRNQNLFEVIEEAYNLMKTRGTPNTIIRMNNAGENQVVKKEYQEKYYIKV